MKLDEAIMELEEHGYALNEWKITPDFGELSDEDKKLLTKAMNGMYTAKKSGNQKNIAKYTVIIKDIAGKMKNDKAIKKLAKMVGSVSNSTPAPTPKKEPEGTIHQRRSAFLDRIADNNAKAKEAGMKDYGEEYRQQLRDIERQAERIDNYDELEKLFNSFNQKTWLFKDYRVSSHAENVYDFIKDKLKSLKPKVSAGSLDVFAKLEKWYNVEKTSNGSLEITGRDFCFTIHPDLSYDLTAFGTNSYDGDDYESDTSGKFKDTILTRTPDYIKDLIKKKVDNLLNWED